MKRPVTLLVSTTAAAVALVLSGCASSPGTSSSNAPLNLIVPAGTFQKAIQPVLDQFTKETGIKVNQTVMTIPETETHEILDVTSKSSSLDLIVLDDVTYIAEMYSGLLPLNSLLAKSKVDTSDFFPGLVDLFSRDGEQYAFPLGTSPWVLVYRSDLLAAAGLKPPTTYAQLATDAAKLTGNGHYGLVVAAGDPSTLMTIWFQYAINAGLKSVLNSAGTEATFDNAAGLAGLTALESIYRKGDMPPDAISDDAGGAETDLENGEAAMSVLPISVLEPLNEASTDKYAGDFKIAPDPTISTSIASRSLTTGWGYAISKYSDNQTNAWKLEEYLIDAFEKPAADAPSAMVQYPNSESALAAPATTKLYSGDQINVLKQALEAPIARPASSQFDAISTAIGDDLEDAFTGKMSAQQALSAASSAVDSILKQ